MDFKKAFYEVEELFIKNNYKTAIKKICHIFEDGLKQLYDTYYKSITNPNDRKQIDRIVDEIGDGTKSVESFKIHEMLQLESNLKLLFQIRKMIDVPNRFQLFNLNYFEQYKNTICREDAQADRIDTEIFLIFIKIFLNDFQLMKPLHQLKKECKLCGNPLHKDSNYCLYCGNKNGAEPVIDTPDSSTVVNNTVVTKQATMKIPNRIKTKVNGIKQNSFGYFEGEFLNNTEMVFVPEGSFLMGTEMEGSFAKEHPEHRLNLDAYWISKFPVSFDQYDTFCNQVKKIPPKDEGWGRQRMPVINITWYDATEYCEWLSNKSGLNFRLPTEAEWERAAKGEDSRIYPWGEKKPDSQIVNFEYFFSKTTEIDRFPEGQSPFGVYDMSGNVWEWCHDWYGEQYYKVSPSHNPKGPVEGDTRIIRGGGWGYDASFLRTTNRNRWIPEDSNNVIGFRVVLDHK